MKNLKLWTEQLKSRTERVAIPIMTHPGIELIGATVKQAACDGRTHFEAIKAVNERFSPAATTVIMDLTVEAEAFGAEVIFPENEIPSVVGRLLEDEEAIENLQVPDLTKGRISQYLLANKLSAEYFNDKPVFAGCIGPFSLAGRLYDMSEIMMLCYSEPESAAKLLQKCADFLLRYCIELKNTGVDGIVIAEPAAGLLSNDGCAEFSSQYIKQIVDALQEDNFMIVLHNCGNTGHCTEAMLTTGAQSLHFGNKADMLQILEQCPSDILVWGNLDPVSMFKQATVEEMKKGTWDLLKKTSEYRNYVLSSGCDTPPHAPMENIQAFFDTLEEYNKTV